MCRAWYRPSQHPKANKRGWKHIVNSIRVLKKEKFSLSSPLWASLFNLPSLKMKNYYEMLGMKKGKSFYDTKIVVILVHGCNDEEILHLIFHYFRQKLCHGRCREEENFCACTSAATRHSIKLPGYWKLQYTKWRRWGEGHCCAASLVTLYEIFQKLMKQITE